MKYISRSEIGKVRGNNEDMVMCLADLGVFAVADGMGGGAEGERASMMVCDRLRQIGVGDGFVDRMDAIDTAIRMANRDIRKYATQRGFRSMGSTVALVALNDGDLRRSAICHVGDSRVYRLRAGKVELLTRDHSVGAAMEERIGGEAGSKFALRGNPLAHVLTRVIGGDPRLAIDWRKLAAKPADRYLICSDGVHDVIATDELPGIIGQGELAKVADDLSGEVVKRGAPDNYSFIVIEV